jgi:hypothetical protein
MRSIFLDKGSVREVGVPPGRKKSAAAKARESTKLPRAVNLITDDEGEEEEEQEEQAQESVVRLSSP